MIYPVRYMCTWYRYILCAICVPGTDISCVLYVYLVQIYPVLYMCSWYRYILCAICALYKIDNECQQIRTKEKGINLDL